MTVTSSPHLFLPSTIPTQQPLATRGANQKTQQPLATRGANQKTQQPLAARGASRKTQQPLATGGAIPKTQGSLAAVGASQRTQQPLPNRGASPKDTSVGGYISRKRSIGSGLFCFTHSSAFGLYTMCSGIPALVGLFERLNTLSLFLTATSFARGSSSCPLWWLETFESSDWPLCWVVAAEFSDWPLRRLETHESSDWLAPLLGSGC